MLRHRQQHLGQLGEGRQRAVRDRENGNAARGRLFGDVHDFRRIEAEGYQKQEVGLPRDLRHVRRETATGIEQHGALAQHGQHIAQQVDHRRGPQLPDQIDRVGLLHHVGGERDALGINVGQQILQGCDIPRHEVAEESDVAFPRAPQFAFQRLDPRVEAGRGGRQPALEHDLEILEALVAKGLRIADKTGGVNPAFLADGIHRQHRDIVRILRQEQGDLLVRPAHVVVPVMDQPDEFLIGFRRTVGHRDALRSECRGRWTSMEHCAANFVNCRAMH